MGKSVCILANSTVGELKKAIAEFPDDAPVLLSWDEVTSAPIRGCEAAKIRIIPVVTTVKLTDDEAEVVDGSELVDGLIIFPGPTVTVKCRKAPGVSL